MKTSNIVEAFVKALKEEREERENELEDKVSIITKLFNNFKEEKDDNYNGFREFINGKECLCHIKGYAEFINNLSDDEVKQVINNTGLTQDELYIFIDILIDRVIKVKNDIIDSIRKLQSKFVNQINNETTNNVDFESMSKEELIDYIKKNK